MLLCSSNHSVPSITFVSDEESYDSLVIVLCATCDMTALLHVRVYHDALLH
jgi:hypothetical protein